MSASRRSSTRSAAPTHVNPRMTNPTSDVNLFYSTPPVGVAKMVSNTVGTPSMLKSTSKRPSLRTRHKVKKQRQFKRVGLLTLLLLGFSTALWMFGLMIGNVVQERLSLANPTLGLAQAPPMTASTTKTLENTSTILDTWQIPVQGTRLSILPSFRVWQSPTPFTPLLHPSLASEQRQRQQQLLIDTLSQAVEPTLKPHILLLDGQNFQFAGRRIEEPVPSASVIKLPLLYLYALHLNSGALQNDTPAYFDERHKVEGSGDWQFLGTQKFYTAFQTAEAMIQSSDNSATELMTDLLGGQAVVNQELKALGLHHTMLRHTLPDVEGYNTISVYDMVTLMMNLKEHPIFRTESKATAMEILEGTHNRRLIPALLPPDTLVAHKTGDIGKSLGDTALVYLPDGRYYYLSVMVERPHNDASAKAFIQRLSKAIWDTYEESPSTQVVQGMTPLKDRFQSTANTATNDTSTSEALPPAELF